MVKHVDLHQVFLQLEVLEAMITVTPTMEVTTMGVAGRMLPQGASWPFFSESLHSFKQQITTTHGKYLEIWKYAWCLWKYSLFPAMRSFWILPWNAMVFLSNLHGIHAIQEWDVYWPCYGRLCLIFQYQFLRIWEPQSGWWNRCQNIYHAWKDDYVIQF